MSSARLFETVENNQINQIMSGLRRVSEHQIASPSVNRLRRFLSHIQVAFTASGRVQGTEESQYNGE